MYETELHKKIKKIQKSEKDKYGDEEMKEAIKKSGKT